MKPFSLLHPTSIDEALSVLPSEHPADGAAKTKVLAGGQDLLTELKEHLVEADTVVDLKRIPGLDSVERITDGGLSIGALVTLTELEEALEAEGNPVFDVLAQAAASVASPQIRNQGTVGGNLCQRPRCWYYRLEDAVCLKKGGEECFSYGGMSKFNAILGGGPSYIVHPSDLAPALVALGSEIVLASPRGERQMPLGEFFTLPSESDVLFENVLAADEVVVRLIVPGQKLGTRSAYLKFRERGSYDFALASAALTVKLAGDTIESASLVLGGVAPIPWRCTSTEELVAGKPMTQATWKEAAEDALADAEPLDHNGFKVPLTKGVIRRAFEALAEQA
jgi:xanthine dehydrogenase YagS FAD-binding subunit